MDYYDYIKEYINNKSKFITDNILIDNNKNREYIINTIIDGIKNEISELSESKYRDDILYMVNNNVETLINEFITQINSIQRRKDQVIKLQGLDLPKQRSEEWYQQRKQRLTASSLATALKSDKYKSRYELINDKIQDYTPYIKNDILEHGIKYEEIATQFYEHINNVNILEFGLIPHPEFTMFGASPDGICDNNSHDKYIGRMLEIKCPPKRKFTKSVPEHYWMQIQGQLQCCNLDECDFLQVKISEYNSEEEYNMDKYCIDNTLQFGYTSTEYPKGCIIVYTDGDDNKYLYPGLFKSNEELNQWIKEKKEWIDENNYTFKTINWWKIERYECTLVYRDDMWWSKNIGNIIQFWKDVDYYKEHRDELSSKIPAKKEIVYINNLNTDKCLL
ncbi:MAG: hypothetical protein CMG46_01615 [Candidatus Marinimicrobia bacterium]|nr:hypothetical protein [Candidatus Neomarinimicrobiota bacterium]